MINNKNPKISVVMSVFNGERYLAEAIDSILEQSFKDFEFIIIDDGSTDGTKEIIERYLYDNRIKYFYQKNKGSAAARNLAVFKSTGKYIAVIDADDISLPERFKFQYDFLEKHSECVAVGSNAEVIDKDGNYVYTSNKLLDLQTIREALPKMYFVHSSVMFRRNIFWLVGGYPEAYIGEDTLLWNKLEKLGELRNLSKSLIKYRLVPTAITTKSATKEGKILTAIMNRSIKDNRISDSDKKTLKNIVLNRTTRFQYSIYHLHVAKKYLWNNCQPSLARKNLLLSIKNGPLNYWAYFYLLVSFLPKNVILFLYNSLKKGSFE